MAPHVRSCLNHRRNRLATDSGTHSQVVNLIESVPCMSSRTRLVSIPRAFEDFLRTNSPPPPSSPLREMSVPIFPRNRQPGKHLDHPTSDGGRLSPSFRALPALPMGWLSVIDVKEEDLADEHLAVVDGWGTCSVQLLSPYTA